MFLAIAGALGGLLSSGMAADAQKRMAKAVDKASTADLPPAWKSALQNMVNQSAAARADFQQSVSDQDKLVKAALIGGGVLLVVFVLLR
jgi:hypothetical protein